MNVECKTDSNILQVRFPPSNKIEYHISSIYINEVLISLVGFLLPGITDPSEILSNFSSSESGEVQGLKPTDNGKYSFSFDPELCNLFDFVRVVVKLEGKGEGEGEEEGLGVFYLLEEHMGELRIRFENIWSDKFKQNDTTIKMYNIFTDCINTES